MASIPSFDQILEFVKALGVIKGTFVLFFWVAHVVIFSQYRGRIKDRGREIQRLADENKEHRERFTALIDQKLRVPKHLLPQQKPKKKSGRK